MEQLGDTPAGTADLPQVVAAIRQAILDGHYGPGQRLVEIELCDEYTASRFNVRAALRELAADGLVEMQPYKGARVRVVPLEEAIEIVEVRIVLEGLTASRAAERANAADIQELQQIVARMRYCVEQGELVMYGQLNATLHHAIQRISDNDTCNRALERLRAQVVRHQFALSLQPGRPNVSLPQHERIVAAISSHDPLAAETAMRLHLSSVRDAMSNMTLAVRSR